MTTHPLPPDGIPPYVPPAPAIVPSYEPAPPPVQPKCVAAVLSLGFGLAAWSMFLCANLVSDFHIHLGSVFSVDAILITTAAISLLYSIVAIVCGHSAVGRIRASQGRQRGMGFAATGLILG
jgi:hypothetical protein